jgi:phosphotransferase system HPr-like phosphotransfer protein
MTNIISFKVSSRSFTLPEILGIHQLCQTLKCNVYVHKNGATCKVKQLTKFVSIFLTTFQHDDFLVIVEGEEDANVIRKIIHCFFYKNRKLDDVI